LTKKNKYSAKGLKRKNYMHTLGIKTKSKKPLETIDIKR